MKWIVVALLLTGCAFQMAEVSIAGQGAKSGTETRTIDCDGSGEIAVGIQGEGDVDVKVTDAAGEVLFSKSFAAGQSGATQTLDGASGTWTLTVTFGGAFGFSGQYGITLSC